MVDRKCFIKLGRFLGLQAGRWEILPPENLTRLQFIIKGKVGRGRRPSLSFLSRCYIPISVPSPNRAGSLLVLPYMVKKPECWRIDAFELWCWRRLLRVPWTARRSNQFILKEISPGCLLEGLMLKLKLQYFGLWCEELTHWKQSWCWGRLKTGGEGDDRGWDGKIFSGLSIRRVFHFENSPSHKWFFVCEYTAPLLGVINLLSSLGRMWVSCHHYFIVWGYLPCFCCKVLLLSKPGFLSNQ